VFATDSTWLLHIDVNRNISIQLALFLPCSSIFTKGLKDYAGSMWQHLPSHPYQHEREPPTPLQI